MRNVVLQMMTTLNGRLDDPDAWVVGMTDDLYAAIDRTYDAFDTILVGWPTYEEMVAYWPDAGNDQDGSTITRSIARKMNSYRKYVFADRTVRPAPAWTNAEYAPAHCDEDIVNFVNALKEQPGGDIHLAGGARLAASMIRLGLVDEYRFFVHPVASAGAAWFDQIDGVRPLEILSTTVYDNGVVGMYDRPGNRR